MLVSYCNMIKIVYINYHNSRKCRISLLFRKLGLIIVKTKDYLTTGQAAVLFSVDPDTVLRWIKTGKIPAYRTPGGHYRIHRDVFLTRITEETCQIPNEPNRQPYPYCWEYNSKDGEIHNNCQTCIVYRSRTRRCYELIKVADMKGHSKIFCTESCHTCKYFKSISERSFLI